MSAGSRSRGARFATCLAGFGLATMFACSNVNDGGPVAMGGAPSSGGMPATSGGATSGGATSGGASSGGATSGGASSGGTPSSGGASSGGATSGGASSGGASSGGTPSSGGASSGGAFSGGASSGGTSSGGAASGGASQGGSGAGKGGSAGAGGGAGGSAGGGSTDYRPCPTNGDPCRILPLGDSITWGIQYDGAYRVELFNRAVAAKQKITFTGSLSNGPTTVAGTTFPRKNEGHSGWTIDQDASLVPNPAFSTIPHIVLLHIGTNDVYAASGQSTMANRLGSLMDKIIAAAPEALLVVAKIVPLSSSGFNATIKTYNDAMPALVETRAKAGKHVMLVDLNSGFQSSMLSTDNVHPNKSGYDFMGGVWYTAISKFLPQ